MNPHLSLRKTVISLFPQMLELLIVHVELFIQEVCRLSETQKGKDRSLNPEDREWPRGHAHLTPGL